MSRSGALWSRGRRLLSAQSGERLALAVLLSLLALCCAPWRFCALRYDYIPAERLASELLERPRAVAAVPQCPPPSGRPAAVAVRMEPATDAQLAALAVGAPANCTARYRVALVVPYRARAAQLRAFLYHMHPFLRAQGLDYRIYVVEQTTKVPFNRGKLLNVGVAEATAEWDVDCVVLHDVDRLPEDLGNLYACGRQPRHLSARVNTQRYHLPYRTLAGGVLAVTVDAFRRANGFSNVYSGWGGEDDDFSARLAAAGARLTRPDPRVSRYIMLAHARQPANGDRHRLLREALSRAAADGLSSLRYTVLARQERRTHRWILVDL